ncbi:hypothetical protein RhiXN_11980 [Rhizoctonia solani]|uniref:Uncharacterized protein n=1 Tax=Rhizoctonia solani TaxID=456999 RepID=A0A8H8T2G6_9AGAM|nr:uncharacterized protein RhiXN_11980 [Rhizoctonia solani]QRW26319.1 hypothetical protein RhiXN_11980 [Rhizoctonia solani]
MLNTLQKQSEKRKSEPSLRLTKKAKITTGVKVHDIDESADEDYFPRPTQPCKLSGGEEDADEDGYEGKDDTTPFGRIHLEGKAMSSRQKRYVLELETNTSNIQYKTKPTKGKGKTQDKNGIAESYRTRKKNERKFEFTTQKSLSGPEVNAQTCSTSTMVRFSLLSTTTWDEPKEDSAQTLQTLQERFGLRDSSHRTIINHMQVATELAPGIDLQLGLVLDTEWEHIIIGALDVGDLDYALKALDLLKEHHAGQVENLDLRLLNHPYPMQDVAVFSELSDKLQKAGYPIGPDRLSYLIDSHLHSHTHERLMMDTIKTTQDLIHKLEAQGTPPSQKAYVSIMRAYLDVSRDSNLLSEPSGASQTNPSASIAAIHDLFTHMRYAAHPNPSLETYSVVIAACARGHQVNPLRALELLQEIKQGLISGRSELTQPQLDTRSLVDCYNGAIRACARAGTRFAGDAFRLAKELIQPDGIPVSGRQARWILTEAMRAQSRQFENGSEVILDEEIMVCAFQAYSAFRPAFKRGMTRKRTEKPEDTPLRDNMDDVQNPILSEIPAPVYTIPQSAPEVLREADILFSRILSRRTASPDRVLFTCRSKRIYFVNILELLARAAESDRSIALAYAEKTWIDWKKWIQRLHDGQVDPVLAEATPRATERAWAAIIRAYSLCDNVETALALLREFVTKYPPASLNDQSPPSSPVQRSRLEYAIPANSEKSLTSLLATPTPRVGLLRLVSRHSHRKADIAFY